MLGVGSAGVILLAEDNDGDFLLAREALADADIGAALHRVKDSDQLGEYLARSGRFQDRRSFPDPDLILLDLNMPRKGGCEIVREIRKHPRFRHVPVVALTTSRAEQDIVQCYDAGVSSFIVKPESFKGLVETLGIVGRYWLRIVERPSSET